ncbi:Arrestin-like protein [Nannochloropsis gaditana]|uniref:Arrestin-like protein n=1 Tax=Nannochloropsis gaditana TaxID=72520 RepID=W7TI01_9STRA|nr:Arrestin-like protein [Nannochloropsis gaditana]
MGNAGSNGNVSLGVETEKMAYMAGETVKGTVSVLIAVETQTTGVFLRVKGLEKVYFTERRSGRDMEDRDRTLQDEVSFFDVKMPLLTAQAGVLGPGQYQIPFSFALPDSLPGTLPEEEGVSGSESYRCSVEYEVLAYVDIPGLLSSNVQHRRLLTVTAAMNPWSVQSGAVEKTNKVCLLCCIPRGEVWMRASMPQSHYRPGETASLVVDIHNRSPAAVRHVTVRLLRRLRLGTRSSGWVYYNSDVLTSLKLAGLRPGQQRMDQAAEKLGLVLASTDGKPLTAEVLGSIVECTYVVEVTAKVNWAPLMAIEIPIHVYHGASPPPSSLPETHRHEPLPPLPTATAVPFHPILLDAVDIPLASVTSAPASASTVQPISVLPSAPSLRGGREGKSLE